MRKSPEQILRYIAKCEFSVKDWKQILAYCKRIKLRVHKSTLPIMKVTYADFIDWYENGVATGDIVTDGSIVGIVGDNLNNGVRLCAYVSDGVFYPSFIDVGNVSIAEENVRRQFSDTMAKHNFQISVRLGKLVKLNNPGNQRRVRYQYDGETGVGIISSKNDNETIMAFTVSNGVLEKDVKFRNDEVRFFSIDADGIAEIDNSLRKHSLMWDKKKMRLCHTFPRSANGETYWFITDRFTISSAKERGLPIDKVKYESRNYFTVYEEALDFLYKIKEMRGWPE